MQPKGITKFGHNGGTLVVEYRVTPELLRIHAKLYRHLIELMQSCNISDVDTFMATDANFMFAKTLRSHITLYKGFYGDLPTVALQPVTLDPMPTIYPPT